MYEKNLSEDLRLRLSQNDMEFLRSLSLERSVSISECIRTIISEYRRSIDALNALRGATQILEARKGLSNGDTETNINHKL